MAKEEKGDTFSSASDHDNGDEPVDDVSDVTLTASEEEAQDHLQLTPVSAVAALQSLQRRSSVTATPALTTPGDGPHDESLTPGKDLDLSAPSLPTSPPCDDNVARNLDDAQLGEQGPPMPPHPEDTEKVREIWLAAQEQATIGPSVEQNANQSVGSSRSGTHSGGGKQMSEPTVNSVQSPSAAHTSVEQGASSMHGCDLLEKIAKEISHLEEDFRIDSEEEDDGDLNAQLGVHRGIDFAALGIENEEIDDDNLHDRGCFTSTRPTGVTKLMDRDYLEARTAIIKSLQPGESKPIVPLNAHREPSKAPAKKPAHTFVTPKGNYMKKTAASQGHETTKKWSPKKRKTKKPKKAAGDLQAAGSPREKGSVRDEESTPASPSEQDKLEEQALDEARQQKLQERVRKESLLQQTEGHRVCLTSKDVPGKVIACQPNKLQSELQTAVDDAPCSPHRPELRLVAPMTSPNGREGRPVSAEAQPDARAQATTGISGGAADDGSFRVGLAFGGKDDPVGHTEPYAEMWHISRKEKERMRQLKEAKLEELRRLSQLVQDHRHLYVTSQARLQDGAYPEELPDDEDLQRGIRRLLELSEECQQAHALSSQRRELLAERVRQSGEEEAAQTESPKRREKQDRQQILQKLFEEKNRQALASWVADTSAPQPKEAKADPSESSAPLTRTAGPAAARPGPEGEGTRQRPPAAASSEPKAKTRKPATPKTAAPVSPSPVATEYDGPKPWREVASKPDRRSAAFSNSGCRLYGQGVLSQRRKDTWAQEEKQRLQAWLESTEECTFSPQISDFAHTHTGGRPSDEALKARDPKKWEELQKRYGDLDMKECTFQPRLNSRSVEMVSDKGRDSESPLAPHERLHLEKVERARRRQQLQEMGVTMSTCSGRLSGELEPVPRGAARSQDAKTLDRLVYSKRDTVATIEKVRAEIQKVREKTLFKPHILTKERPSSSAFPPDADFHTRLYEQGRSSMQGKEMAQEEVARSLREASNVSHYIDKNSDYLVQQLRSNKIRAIFDALDTKGEGVFTVEDIHDLLIDCAKGVVVAPHVQISDSTAMPLTVVMLDLLPVLDSANHQQFTLQTFTEVVSHYLKLQGPSQYLVPDRRRPTQGAAHDSRQRTSGRRTQSDGSTYDDDLSTTFRPVLNRRSMELMEEKALAASQTSKAVPRVADLHREKQAWVEKRERLRADKMADEMRECTFQPNADRQRRPRRAPPAEGSPTGDAAAEGASDAAPRKPPDDREAAKKVEFEPADPGSAITQEPSPQLRVGPLPPASTSPAGLSDESTSPCFSLPTPGWMRVDSPVGADGGQALPPPHLSLTASHTATSGPQLRPKGVPPRSPARHLREPQAAPVATADHSSSSPSPQAGISLEQVMQNYLTVAERVWPDTTGEGAVDFSPLSSGVPLKECNPEKVKDAIRAGPIPKVTEIPQRIPLAEAEALADGTRTSPGPEQDAARGPIPFNPWSASPTAQMTSGHQHLLGHRSAEHVNTAVVEQQPGSESPKDDPELLHMIARYRSNFGSPSSYGPGPTTPPLIVDPPLGLPVAPYHEEHPQHPEHASMPANLTPVVQSPQVADCALQSPFSPLPPPGPPGDVAAESADRSSGRRSHPTSLPPRASGGHLSRHSAEMAFVLDVDLPEAVCGVLPPDKHCATTEGTDISEFGANLMRKQLSTSTGLLDQLCAQLSA